jgi:hypothetical protein
MNNLSNSNWLLSFSVELNIIVLDIGNAIF